MSRPIPTEALDITAKWEGFRATAYFCPANVPTIGYGHTKTVTAEDVGHKTISEHEARALLAADMDWAQRAVERAIGVAHVARLSDKQYAALLSFAFNLGADPGWTIWAKIKARDDAAVPAQLGRFVNAGGRRLEGLVRRRADEARLWVEGTGTVPVPPPTEPVAPPPPPPRPAPSAPPPRREPERPSIMAALAALLSAILAVFSKRSR